jgi:hypothetical protein
MTTPHVHELPLHLEPTTADHFLDDGATDSPGVREPDRREEDGTDVREKHLRQADPVLGTVIDAVVRDGARPRSRASAPGRPTSS